MLSTAYIKSFLSSYFLKRKGPVRDFYFEKLRPAYMKFEGEREKAHWAKTGKKFLDEDEVRLAIRAHLKNKKPYTLAKIGGNELALLEWLYGASIAEVKFIDLHQNAGIFPPSKPVFREFAALFAESLKSLSLLGLWMGKGEPAIYEKTGMTADITSLGPLTGHFGEIAVGKDRSWFSELKGYRILVISSFADQIASRANEEDWNRYWAGRLPWIAPAEVIPAPFPYGFEKKTQDRFENSFRLLEEFKKQHQASLERADIVLAGCGAYAVPLLDWAHKNGKVGVHMGGEIQILFGIKGSRWENREGPLGALCNEHWVKPSYIPESANLIEDSCYW